MDGVVGAEERVSALEGPNEVARENTDAWEDEAPELPLEAEYLSCLVKRWEGLL